MRQRVGALNGKGAATFGRLGLVTNCASRTNALSGSWSKTDLWAGLVPDGVTVSWTLGFMVLLVLRNTKPVRVPSVARLKNCAQHVMSTLNAEI